MLAPRKKLWSTPPELVSKAIELLDIEFEDIVYDIGCGDGRFLITAALKTQAIKFIGIEIDHDRAIEATNNIIDASLSDKIEILNQNALECNFNEATVIFLYLVPRGLRIILPYLEKIDHPIKVVTYMSPLPDIKPLIKEYVKTSKGGEWPIFKYLLNKEKKKSWSLSTIFTLTLPIIIICYNNFKKR